MVVLPKYNVHVRVGKCEQTFKAIAPTAEMARLHVLSRVRQEYGVRESVLFLRTEVVA